jgi:phospholipase C
VLIVVAIASVLGAARPTPASAAELDPSMPFDHIVVIVEQDHTYDSYFGSYVSPESRADGPSANDGVQSLADNYVLFDNYFASSPGGTLGNMLDLTTGDTHELLFSSKESLAALADLDVPTIFDRLNQQSVEWRLYDGGLSEVDERKVMNGAYAAPGAAVPASLYRAPVLAMKRTWRDPDLTSRFVDQQQFFDDARAGTLPPFSLVLPSPSDRPGLGGAEGEIRLLSLINAVQKGSQWERTAIFVTWDDGGGQFDSAVPPVGNGLRVPLLLISPYAKQGYTSHVEHDHLSLLDLVEARFDLASLGPRPSAAPAFDDAFAVETGPRPPIITTRGGLAPTPVGTTAQNLQTVALYAIGLTAAAFVARAAWHRERRRVI